MLLNATAGMRTDSGNIKRGLLLDNSKPVEFNLPTENSNPANGKQGPFTLTLVEYDS
jgi:hypothetical protein